MPHLKTIFKTIITGIMLVAAYPVGAGSVNIFFGGGASSSTAIPPGNPPFLYEMGYIGGSITSLLIAGYHSQSSYHRLWGMKTVSGSYGNPINTGDGAIDQGIVAQGTTASSTSGSRCVTLDITADPTWVTNGYYFITDNVSVPSTKQITGVNNAACPGTKVIQVTTAATATTTNTLKYQVAYVAGHAGLDATGWGTFFGTFGSSDPTVIGAAHSSHFYWCAIEGLAGVANTNNYPCAPAQTGNGAQFAALVTAYDSGTKTLTVSDTTNFYGSETTHPSVHTPVLVRLTGSPSSYFDTVASKTATTVTLTTGHANIDVSGTQQLVATGGMNQRFGTPTGFLYQVAVQSSHQGSAAYSHAQAVMNHIVSLYPSMPRENIYVTAQNTYMRLDGTSKDESFCRSCQGYLGNGGSNVTVNGNFAAGSTQVTVTDSASGANMPAVGQPVYLPLVPVSSAADCGKADPTTCTWGTTTSKYGTQTHETTVASGSSGLTLKFADAIPAGFLVPSGGIVGDARSLVATSGNVAGGSATQNGFIGNVSTPGTLVGDFSTGGHTVGIIPLPYNRTETGEIICTLTNSSAVATSCNHPDQLIIIKNNVALNGGTPVDAIINANNAGIAAGTLARSIASDGTSFTLSSGNFSGTTGLYGFVINSEELGRSNGSDQNTSGQVFLGQQLAPYIDSIVLN